MYSSLHAATGTLIVVSIPNPAISFPLAIASHYLLDAIPHGDMRKPPRWLQLTEGRRLLETESLDLPLSALVIWKFSTIFPTVSPGLLILGAIAAILPDILWGGKFLLEKFNWPIPGLPTLLDRHHLWHERIHVKATRDIPFWAGIAYHLMIVGAILLLR